MKSDRISGHCVAAAGFLSAAANAKRIQILQNLAEREFSVNELADRIGLSQRFRSIFQSCAKSISSKVGVKHRRFITQAQLLP